MLTISFGKKSQQNFQLTWIKTHILKRDASNKECKGQSYWIKMEYNVTNHVMFDSFLSYKIELKVQTIWKEIQYYRVGRPYDGWWIVSIGYTDNYRKQ